MNFITSSSAVRTGSGTFQTIVEIRTESISEVTPADSMWAVGSLAWEVSTGKIYGLTQNGWIEQTSE